MAGSNSAAGGLGLVGALDERAPRLRVLHVAATLSPIGGGIASTLRSLLPALKSCGVDSTLATTSWRPGEAPAPPIAGVTGHCFPVDAWSRVWPAHSPSLARFLRSQTGGFDVVHVHELWHHANYAACRAAIEQRVPYVLSPHGAFNHWLQQRKMAKRKHFKKHAYMHAVQRTLIRRASALHALTEYEAADVGVFGFKTPTFVAPVGVDTELVADVSERSSFLKRWGLAGKQVVLFLGRLAPIKGLDLLARGFVELASRHPDAVLLVAGPDQEGTQRKMQQFLRREGLADRAVFTGWLDAAGRSAALSAADVFVLPSYSEGFSSAVLEAMAAGLPVIITEHCHFPIVAEQRAGVVIGAVVEDLARELDTLLGQPELRKTMGGRARDLVANQYRWGDCAAKLTEQYRAIAQRGSERLVAG